MAQRICALASFKVKYQCPELGLARFEISPCTRKLKKEFSNIDFTWLFSSVTEIALVSAPMFLLWVDLEGAVLLKFLYVIIGL